MAKHLPDSSGFDLKHILVEPGKPISLKKDFDPATHPSTDWAPWFVVPADHKWFTRLCVSEIVVATLKSLGLKYPKIGDVQLAELQKAKEELLKEK